MYRIGKYEFMQYKLAEKRYKELKKIHAMKLQQAYDNISPSMTRFDYELGNVYSASVSTEEYAIYLVELREEQEKEEEYWRKRSEAYKKAFNTLTESEKEDLSVYKPGNLPRRERAKNKVRRKLTEIVASIPELQRKHVSELDDVEEYDKRIDAMSKKELFSDYWSLDEQLEKEGIKDKCYYLRDVHEMSFKQIGEMLGITTFRAKEIIMQSRA